MENKKDIRERDERARKRKKAKAEGNTFKPPAILEYNRRGERYREWNGEPIDLDDGQNKTLGDFNERNTES